MPFLSLLVFIHAIVPIQNSVADDGVGWFYVANLGPTLDKIEESNFAPLLPSFITPSLSHVLKQPPSVSLLGVAGIAPHHGWRYGLWIDAGAATEALFEGAQQRLHRYILDTSSTADQMHQDPQGNVFTLRSQRFGWATDRRTLDMGYSPAAKSIGQSQAFLKHQAGKQLLHAHIDMQRFYSALAKDPSATTWAARLSYAGLLDVIDASAWVDLPQKALATFEATVRRKGDPKGLLAALGPPIPPLNTSLLSQLKSIHGARRISLQPVKLYQSVMKLYGYSAPLQFTLLMAHLQGIEQRAQVQLEDVLGDAPAVWSWY
ncbi:MAG: hypothetical protein R3C68_16775, partial [Myxococcota bacterium]